MKRSGRFLIDATNYYNNPKKKYQTTGATGDWEMLDTGVKRKTADSSSTGQPAWKTRTFSKEELAKMHKGKKYGKNIFQKIATKITGRGSDRGGIIPAIKGACGPHGCLKPGMKKGGSVKVKKKK